MTEKTDLDANALFDLALEMRHATELASEAYARVLAAERALEDARLAHESASDWLRRATSNLVAAARGGKQEGMLW